MASNPPSPSLPTPSPPSPHFPVDIDQPGIAPRSQLMTTFSPLQHDVPTPSLCSGEVTSPTLINWTYPWSHGSTNGPMCRRNSLVSPRPSPSKSQFMYMSGWLPVEPFDAAESANLEPFQNQTTASKPREVAQPNRKATPSPVLDRAKALPLRVDTRQTNDTLFPESIEEDRDPHLSLSPTDSDATTLVNWSPLPPSTPSKRRARSRAPSPTASTRSPIRKRPRLRISPPPRSHVAMTRNPPSPTHRIRAHYTHCVDHLRIPLVPLISVTTGLPHPDFPRNLLQYHLLTHAQLDSLARWYHQVTPPVAETFNYPAWIPAWTSLHSSSTVQGTGARARPSDPVHGGEHVHVHVDLETKRRRWGRFIGLRGCESPTAEPGVSQNTEAESADQVMERMEREWTRALERAAAEQRQWEKGWTGRW